MKQLNKTTFYYKKNQPYWAFILSLGISKLKANKKPFKIIKYTDWWWISCKLGHALSHNLRASNFREHYDVYVYATKEEAEQAYDNKILSYAGSVDTEFRDRLYKQLIKLKPINRSELEINSIAWFENLSSDEKKYVSFLKYKYKGKLIKKGL